MLNDLLDQIEEHSHYDEDPANFWETMHDKYWDKYVMWCEVHNQKADLSQFSVWAEDLGLVGDDEIWENAL